MKNADIPAMQWISVNDQKIPTDTWVIGYGDDIEFILVNENEDVFVWEGHRETYFGSEITHWMPLPSVPEEK